MMGLKRFTLKKKNTKNINEKIKFLALRITIIISKKDSVDI